MATKTTGQIYDQHQRIGRKLVTRAYRRAKAAHPETGGHPLMVHNWGNEAAKAAWDDEQNRTSRVRHAFERLYAEAEHRKHVGEGRVGAYLWCDACQAVEGYRLERSGIYYRRVKVTA